MSAREFGVPDGVDVTSRVFLECVCQSRHVLVGFGLRRGDFGMSRDKKRFGFQILWILPTTFDHGFGFWISDFGFRIQSN